MPWSAWLTEWMRPFGLSRPLETWTTDSHEHYLQAALGY